MQKNSYTYDDLINCGNGELFGPGNAQLPQPPMLMFDRITHISTEGGEYGKVKSSLNSISILIYGSFNVILMKTL